MKKLGVIFIAFVLYFGWIGTITSVARAASVQPAVPAQATTTPPTLISMEGGRLAQSGLFQANIVADAFPKGLAGYHITVGTGDPTIAVAFQFLTPDFGMTAATSTSTTVTMGVVDINSVVEAGAENVVIGTITFLGRSEGITPIEINIARMDDADGFEIFTSTAVGLLTVPNSRDLDGDGITEDVNGNGRFDLADVLMLFRMLLALPPSP